MGREPSPGGGETLAKVAVLGAALSYAFAAIWGRRFRGLPPTITAAGQLSASALVMTPVALLVDRSWALAMPSAWVIGALIALALVSTAAGYIVYFALLGRAGATNVLLVTLLIPPSALRLGALFLGECIEARDLAGLTGTCGVSWSSVAAPTSQNGTESANTSAKNVRASGLSASRS